MFWGLDTTRHTYTQQNKTQQHTQYPNRRHNKKNTMHTTSTQNTHQDTQHNTTQPPHSTHSMTSVWCQVVNTPSLSSCFVLTLNLSACCCCVCCCVCCRVVVTLAAAVNLQQKVLKMLKQSSNRNVSLSSQKKSISSLPSFFSCCRLLRSEHRDEVACWQHTNAPCLV